MLVTYRSGHLSFGEEGWKEAKEASLPRRLLRGNGAVRNNKTVSKPEANKHSVFVFVTIKQSTQKPSR